MDFSSYFTDECAEASLQYLECQHASRQLELELTQGKFIVLKEQQQRALAVKDYAPAILRGDPRCFIKNSTVLFLDANCYIYSCYNCKKCWSALGLKVVCGSLGFGTQEPRWYEHGNPSWTSAKQFMGGSPLSWDWHVWLENDQGLVWDVLPGIWHFIAKIHRKKINLGSSTENIAIEGLSKDHLKRHGLEYIPANEEAQAVLLSMASRLYAPYFKQLQM